MICVHLTRREIVCSTQYLFKRNIEFASLDLVDEIVWVGTVNGASDGLGSAEDLSDSSGKVSGAGSWSHNSGAADDVIHGNVTVVLD